MSLTASDGLRSPLLDSLGWISHQFQPAGVRPPDNTAYGIQRHTANVLPAEQNFPPKQAISDALISHTNQPVAVYTADCLPVLIASPLTRQVAAVHAGLKGTLAGVLQQTLQQLRQQGAPSDSLYIAIGPAIGPCCYQLGMPLLEEMEENPRVNSTIPWYSPPPKNPHSVRSCAPQSFPALWLDLPELARQMLINEGVPDGQIECLQHCTYCMAESGASYRRNTHTGEGYQLRFSWIAANPD
ncbi:polyphenol oxidase family protein [Tatumella citrea]|uniref:Purine nucleoside phosphorylase n=1 Tax=Tatumella citrea TaxID=53336 RepID=A0A1Y0LP32_TATCI|nr:polyphenol oxidase family protein [Tatumella citrea]ARU95268.1 hypothetical protein A7K98_16870 [Tatumella citrea]ARU99308.1 hypothetical protein A7K99_16855 [Tatumella citrea]